MSKKCTFTGSAGTDLKSYAVSGETTWADNSAYTSGSAVLTADGRARSASGLCLLVSNWTPASADYEVSADIHVLSTPTDLYKIGVNVRASTSANVGYYAQLYREGTTTVLRLYRGGNGTPLGSISPTLVNGTTYRLTLSCKTVGSDVELVVYWNRVPVISVTATGANAVLTTGVAGAYFQASGTPGDAAYWHMDNWHAADSIAPAQADFAYNLYPGTGNPVRSSMSEVTLTTDASEIIVTGTNDIYASYPAWAQLCVIVNGTPASALAFSAAGKQQFSVSLGTAGTSRTVIIREGLQSKPSSSVLSTRLLSFALKDETTYAIASPPTSNLLTIYGNSITVGANATFPQTQGWTNIVRDTGYHAICEAWGYRALYHDANTGILRAALVALLIQGSPNRIWIAHGGNDYGLSLWTAAAFGTAYEALLTDLHTALPNAKIYAQTPLDRTTETANGVGSTMADYRSAIVSAAAGKSYVQVVDGTDILEPDDFADGIHPTTAGQAEYAAYALTVLPIDGVIDGGLNSGAWIVLDTVTAGAAQKSILFSLAAQNVVGTLELGWDVLGLGAYASVECFPTDGVVSTEFSWTLDPGDEDVVIAIKSTSNPSLDGAWRLAEVTTAGGSGVSTGPGSDTVTVNVSIGVTPVENAQVWITSDAEGTNVIAGTLITDSAGDAEFMLDDGLTYYLWAQKDGINSIRGQSFVAEAD